MIYYITGGERSGKSRYAQNLALSLSSNPIYVATARRHDADFEKRILRHQSERDERWTTLEVEKYLSKAPLQGRVAVIDCITLWLVNFFSDCEYNVQQALDQAQAEFVRLCQIDATLIVISNEIGLGVHAPTEGARKFVELQGFMNQLIAQKADHATLMVSGLPLILKEPQGKV